MIGWSNLQIDICKGKHVSVIYLLVMITHITVVYIVVKLLSIGKNDKNSELINKTYLIYL